MHILQITSTQTFVLRMGCVMEMRGPVAEGLAGIRSEFDNMLQWLPDIRSFTASAREYSAQQHSYYAG
jgi:hypothetical protein